jgi:hypothetical protein
MDEWKGKGPAFSFISAQIFKVKDPRGAASAHPE